LCINQLLRNSKKRGKTGGDKNVTISEHLKIPL
jgi:hypothetical protein